MAAEVQALTSGEVAICFADQGYTGEEPKQIAADLGIQLEVVKLAEAKRGFVLLPAPPDGRTEFRVDHPLSLSRPRFRATAGDIGRAALSRLRLLMLPKVIKLLQSSSSSLLK